MKKGNTIADHIKEAHSRIAHEYAGGINSGVYYYDRSRFAHERWEANMFERIFSSVFNRVKPNADTVLLDAGCGNGQWIEYFARKYGLSKFIAVDFSGPMLETAEKRLTHLPIAVRYLESNLESIAEIESGSIDIIHVFGVFEHLENPGKVLGELSRILKKNGHLLLNTPIKYSLCYFGYPISGVGPRYWGEKATWRMRFDFKAKFEDYRFFRKKLVKRLLLSDGFEIVDRYYTSFSYSPAYLGLPYRILPRISFFLQDIYDLACRVVFLNNPAGVYWLVRKKV